MPRSVALIGLGRVGALLEDDPLRPKPASHIGAILSLKSEVKLSGFCDINQKQLNSFQKRWGGGRGYLDYKNCIRKENPDILIIATPTNSHFKIAKFAIDHGVKGIVLEKPVGINFAESEELLHLAENKNTKVVVNHERRWDSVYQKVKEMIVEKNLGELRMVSGLVFSRSYPMGSWQESLKNSGGGPLVHDGTHLIDMIRYFCGNIVTVSGKIRKEDERAGTETTASAWLECENGVEAFITAGGMRNYFHFELDLQFEKGRILVGNGIKKLFVSQKSTMFTGFHDLREEPFPPVTDSISPFSGALKEVLNALNHDLDPFSSLKDGVKVMEIIHAIYTSALKAQKTISLPVKSGKCPLRTMLKKKML